VVLLFVKLWWIAEGDSKEQSYDCQSKN